LIFCLPAPKRGQGTVHLTLKSTFKIPFCLPVAQKINFWKMCHLNTFFFVKILKKSKIYRLKTTLEP